MTVNLGGYPAKQCARVTHNSFSPLAPTRPEPPREVAQRMEAGRAFDAAVVARIMAARPSTVGFDDNAPWDEVIAATMDAMANGKTVIVGGRLPTINQRSGAPDVLVRSGTGYLPVDIKHHRTMSASTAKDPTGPRATRASCSGVDDPTTTIAVPGWSNKGGHWRDDAMQLAHYTRMLQDLGVHASSIPDGLATTLTGGIIGSDDHLGWLATGGVGITWYDLTEANQWTFSTSAAGNKKKRSMLDRYDHEFTFRLKVADAARKGEELVRPYRIDECQTCPWFNYCSSCVPVDDASFTILTGWPTVRGWQRLYGNTELSVADLASLDAAKVETEFAAASVGKTTPARLLANLLRRARMTAEGTDLEPLAGQTVTPPSADVEVDFDIEWDQDGRIYQWGLRIRDGQDDSTARYEPVVTFEPLDDVAEAELAGVFATKIMSLTSTAAEANQSIQIFHWTSPEVSLTRKFPDVEQALAGHTTDLWHWLTQHYFARTTTSIKSIAPLFGFRWQVEDPGGLYSMEQIATARSQGPDAGAAATWCLRYNESDVAAQAAIRDGLRNQTG